MWVVPLLVCNIILTLTIIDDVESNEVTKDGCTTTRWLGDILADTDMSLASLLSQPVDGERVQFALQFVWGYQGVMERLCEAARSRDPRTIQVFRQLKAREFRPIFMDQLTNLSIRQRELGWSNEDLDTLRTAVLKINKQMEEFKSVIANKLL